MGGGGGGGETSKKCSSLNPPPFTFLFLLMPALLFAVSTLLTLPLLSKSKVVTKCQNTHPRLCLDWQELAVYSTEAFLR